MTARRTPPSIRATVAPRARVTAGMSDIARVSDQATWSPMTRKWS
jgi:hypothetical protein